MTVDRFNCILVRYQQGYTYVDRSNGAERKEAFISMMGVKYEENARSIAANVLYFTNQSYDTQLDEGYALELDQVPHVQWTLNKRINDDWVRGFTATQTDDGYASIVHELKDNAIVNIEQIMRRLDRLAAGSESEWGFPNIEREDQGNEGDASPPEFSTSGDLLTPRVSTKWKVPRSWWCSWIEVKLRTAGTSSTRVTLKSLDKAPSLGGKVSAHQSVVVAPNKTYALNAVNVGFPPGVVVFLTIDDAGTLASGLSAGLRGAMI